MAKQLFDELWSYIRNSPFLFPARYRDDKPINETSLGPDPAFYTLMPGGSARRYRRQTIRPDPPAVPVLTHSFSDKRPRTSRSAIAVPQKCCLMHGLVRPC